MRSRILIPLVETLLAIAMFFNWVGDSSFVTTLFGFGFVSGIAVASWIGYIHEQ